MNCLMEALGLALPYNGTALANTAERQQLARRAGKQILELVEKQITPRQIVTPEAIDDAFALDMAMGGSTNTVLHTLAIAHEAGIAYSLERINQVADKVAHLCKVSPSGPWHMQDVKGVSAVMCFDWNTLSITPEQRNPADIVAYIRSGRQFDESRDRTRKPGRFWSGSFSPIPPGQKIRMTVDFVPAVEENQPRQPEYFQFDMEFVLGTYVEREEPAKANDLMLRNLTIDRVSLGTQGETSKP